MSKKRSLVANFADLAAPVPKGAEEPAQPPTEPPKTRPVTRAAAGVIGATQRTLTQLREERDRLQAQVSAQSEGLMSLDTSLIDPSPFRDRLDDDSVDAFEQFKATIARDGQKSPITVRPHPSQAGRYQVVFGHRRLRAAGELGVPVISQVVDYSDHNLIIAQGIENAARQDLSWIERALFAAEMQAAGIKAKEIKGALGVDDAQMSKFRAVTNAIPAHLLEAIGRAPSIGRPRWLELVKLLDDGASVSMIEKTLSDDKVAVAQSDERFRLVTKALQQARSRKQDKVEPRKPVRFGGAGQVWLDTKGLTICVPDDERALFDAFFETEIDSLRERFDAFRKAQTTHNLVR